MDYDQKALGHAISEALERSGVRKADLARRVDKSWPTVNSWCKGSHPPSIADLSVIAEMTGVPIAHFVRYGIPDGRRAPYPAWSEFLETADLKGAEPWMIQHMGDLRLPDGKQPTVETYRRWLFAMTSVQGEPG